MQKSSAGLSASGSSLVKTEKNTINTIHMHLALSNRYTLYFMNSANRLVQAKSSPYIKTIFIKQFIETRLWILNIQQIKLTRVAERILSDKSSPLNLILRH